MWKFNCTKCDREWYAKTEKDTCKCGQTLVSNDDETRPIASEVEDWPRSHLMAYSLGFVLLFALAIAFWFTPTTACYGLTWIVLWVIFARERIWRRRILDIQTTVCEYVNTIESDIEWLTQETDCFAVQYNNFVTDLEVRFGQQELWNAGVRFGPRCQPFDAHRGSWPDDEKDVDDGLPRNVDALDETDGT